MTPPSGGYEYSGTLPRVTASVRTALEPFSFYTRDELGQRNGEGLLRAVSVKKRKLSRGF
jgi:hypothetical protein